MPEIETERPGKIRARGFRFLFYVAIALLALPTGLILSRGCLPWNANERLLQTGQYLVTRTLNGTAREMLNQENSLPHVIAVGPSLAEKLDTLRGEFAASQMTYEVHRGDAAFPLGDGGPGYQLYFLANGKGILALRLGYDIFEDKFRIWGYWTPS